ncbi:uncharacterized protein LOC131440741 [Malaya genurostris]|uniref:uncharacterized protein LOC131440741 n=1 Tax=Malaya genurostris TaxID=325434 RepID=UPI0026F3915D|nr:uncharacterized protein LOC131440741 [Malaya genurostris]
MSENQIWKQKYTQTLAMDSRNKTCLFCLKQRQILVDDSSTVRAIKKMYNITVPSNGCRICIECHFNIGRVFSFKQTIEASSDFDGDGCFVCKSENIIAEPEVNRVVDYLTKQCSTIHFGNNVTVRSCVTCLYLLEISIKYEKLAKNYKNAQRFSKQFASMKDCNVVLWKLDLDGLSRICDGFTKQKEKQKRGQKRSRGSWGPQDEVAIKRSKQEDGSVLPVMLTKLTPTMTPTKAGGKKGSPPNLSPNALKGKVSKQNDKIFIKLPIPRKLQKKQTKLRKKYGTPHSPIKSIPVSPSVAALNQIFGVELRPLFVKIEHVDLSSYMNRTIAHDLNTRNLRKPRKEEFIGLDEEDVVELQQNNTSIGSSVGKRKSILITERIESPNSAKKKVKFSDSPSIKYVDKLNFSDDEDGDKEDNDDENDADYEENKFKKKCPRPQNGNALVSGNGKLRRGRPAKKVINSNTSEKSSEQSTDSTPMDVNRHEIQKSNENLIVHMGNEDKRNTEENENGISESDQIKTPESVHLNGEYTKSLEQTETPIEGAPTDDKDTFSERASLNSAEETGPPIESDVIGLDETVTQDTEMKDLSNVSPEDVEMSENKSPQLEDVEMAEIGNNEITETNTQEINHSTGTQGNSISPQGQNSVDFSSDKEDEIVKVNLNFSDFLGEEISETEQNSSIEQTDSTTGALDDADPGTSAEQNKITIEEKEEITADDKILEVKNQQSSALDDVDDISDDDDVLNQLDDTDESKRNLSPDLSLSRENSL